MLSLMYDTGARIQEMIDLTPACINFNRPYTIRLTGKGNKQRIVPLMDNQVDLLKDIWMQTSYRNLMPENTLCSVMAGRVSLPEWVSPLS